MKPKTFTQSFGLRFKPNYFLKLPGYALFRELATVQYTKVLYISPFARACSNAKTKALKQLFKVYEIFYWQPG